ncbi:MAG TPA: hypothetical protein DGG95_04415 [Cytophagales bacterium]|jgi:uncharacterized membrane protein|nr:hypothetical protein [Cytophagales bacterium]
MSKFAKESLLLILVVVPYIYLLTIWSGLPNRVPTHFDISGRPNDWSDRSFLLWFPALMGLGNYILMLVLPRIDPKKKLEQMGNTYYSIRMILGVFFTVIVVYIMYAATGKQLNIPNFIFILIGAFFALLGNYFQTLKHNYFIGIRTPWTLENEEVWKETHRLAGRLWMVGGLLIIVVSLLTANENFIWFGFLPIILTISLVPIFYSYVKFTKINHSPGR